jgi:hypothetical protein
VRRASVAILGHRPAGSDEVRLLVDLLHAVDAARPPAGDERPARRALVAALVSRNGGNDYTKRWADNLADFLRVQRVDEVANQACSGGSLASDPAAVARLVRDQPPYPPPGAGEPFTLRDVILGAVREDDLSAAYVGHTLSMLAKSFVGANADPTTLELSRRAAVGSWFGAAYLHRDPVCLGCHNAEFSATYSPDPAKNRHFPVPGGLERALFGDPSGPQPLGVFDGITRLDAPFRYAGFAGTSSTVDAADTALPWGWSPQCGSFAIPAKVSDAIAPVDAALGSVSGPATSGWELVAALQRGFRGLREHGLTRDEKGQVTHPDEALGYLVALHLGEQVWAEITGGHLTVAHSYPRNAAARDLLATLADTLVASGFSLQALLAVILDQPTLRQPPPALGCGEGPAPWPPVLDPWTPAEQDPDLRGNGPGDLVAPLSPHTLLHAAHFALGWSDQPLDRPIPFPKDADDSALLADLGAFQKNAEPGFRGFDLQATLAWERRFGRCPRPAAVAADAIDQIGIISLSTKGATLGDALSWLKDRLLGSAGIDPNNEAQLLQILTGHPLATPAADLGPTALDDALRLACGVLLSTPQFRLANLEPGPGPAPTLPPLAGESHADLCAALDGLPLGAHLQARCTGGALVVLDQP